MQYVADVTIPANTPETSIYEQKLKITSGTITEVIVHVPWGCANLVRCQLYRNTWQILPLSRGEYLGGNDITHKYLLKQDVLEEPYEIIIKAYNEDDTFSHTLFVSVSMSRNVISQKLQQLLEFLT